MAVSLHPRDFVMGGLIDDVDVEVTDCRFISTDYDGTLPSATALALQMTMKVLGDDSGNEHLQLFSAGNTADFLPDPETDGKTLIKNGTRESLTKTTNLALFLQSMIDCGAELGPMSAGNVAVLEGLKCHVMRKPAPKRDGLNQARTDAQGREREKTILLCTKIIALPWDKKGRAAGKAAAAQSKPPANATAAQAPAADTGDVDDEKVAAAVQFLMEDLTEHGASTLGQLRLRATRRIKDLGFDKPGKEANQFIAHITSPDFLTENGFDVDDKTVQLP